ncbi:MAG: acetyl-CoA carboxylase, carboxyltransferase subunit beta [Spirochaetaceae bacterium]|jgi:acetyl-CoA carboxylase carboxyl transferase subunit beta|nr:acetyl-CoA carboxylase, carboxyltransferase subunit beta [Spirochaetaceae bacterium]
MAWFSTQKAKKNSFNEDIWISCPKCNKHIFKESWLNGNKVCPTCGHHGKLTAWERIGITLDDGSFVELNGNIKPSDPLEFSDSKGSYKNKVEATTKKTGLYESVITGTGKIDGIPVSIAIMDFRFLGGSLSSGTGEKILRAANYAYERSVPLLIFSASGGARMHEGILSLMQMAKTCAGISRLNEKNIPYISILTDPTTGGVSASFAMVGDVNIAEPGALIAFAGRRVIEETIKQKLPDDFQTAEYLVEHGFIDKIVPRQEMKKTLSQILSFYNR